MPIDLMKKLKNQFDKLNPPTKICKICFKDIKINNLYAFCANKYNFCIDCLNELKPVFNSFYICGIKAYHLYWYDEMVQKYLYNIKGCFDIELAPIFLCRYYKELSLLYKNYIIVSIPSYKADDEVRGFNHVKEIFSPLNLPFENVLYKSCKYKQSDQKKKDRNKIKNILKMSNIEKIKNKKILLVDDVYTTGNTMKTAVKLIQTAGVKKISILLIAKVKTIQTK